MKKYRAKSNVKGDWFFGDLIHGLYDTYISESQAEVLLNKEDEFVLVIKQFTKIEPETICVHTGFKDVNGNDVYEKDILQSSDTQDIAYQVIYRDSAFYLVGRFGIWGQLGLCNKACDKIGIKRMSVIGNIIDTPHFL